MTSWNLSRNFKTNDRKKEKTNCYDLQANRLTATIECNLKTVNFLDITFDLRPTFKNHTVNPMASLFI